MLFVYTRRMFMLIEFPKEIRKGTLSNPKKDSKYIKARL